MWYFDDPIGTGPPKGLKSLLQRRVAQYCWRDSDAKKVYIGKASGRTAIEAMKDRYHGSDFDKDINVMIALYETTSGRNCSKVKASLVEAFKDHPKVTNENEGAAGRHSSAPRQYVFLGLQTPPVYYWDDLQCHNEDTLTKYVRGYCNKKRVEKVYIGIASGDNADSAMKRRYDKFKKDEGINEVIAIYKTPSEKHCKDTERMLVKDAKLYVKPFAPQKVINRAAGGAGRPSRQPRFYVYLALRLTPAGQAT